MFSSEIKEETEEIPFSFFFFFSQDSYAKPWCGFCLLFFHFSKDIFLHPNKRNYPPPENRSWAEAALRLGGVSRVYIKCSLEKR